jgi:hypothetical protein
MVPIHVLEPKAREGELNAALNSAQGLASIRMVARVPFGMGRVPGLTERLCFCYACREGPKFEKSYEESNGFGCCKLDRR